MCADRLKIFMWEWRIAGKRVRGAFTSKHKVNSPRQRRKNHLEGTLIMLVKLVH